MRPRAAALWLAAAAGTFAVSAFAYPWWADGLHSDLPTLRSYGMALASGKLPYRDLPFEYPPLAAPLLALPAVFGERLFHYAFALSQFVAFLVMAGCSSALVRTLGGSVRASALALLAQPLFLGAVAWVHFDLWGAALTAAAALCVARGTVPLAAAALGAGALVKVFPLAAAAPLAGWLWVAQPPGARRRRALAKAFAALALVVAVGATCALLLSVDGTLHFVRYQTERPLEIESSGATALALVALFGGEQKVVFGFGSVGVRGTGDAAIALASAIAGVLAIVSLAFVPALATRARPRTAVVGDSSRARLTRRAERRRSVPGHRAANSDGRAAAGDGDLRATAALLVLAAPLLPVLFGKVLSPQFLVWAWPGLAVLAGLGRWRAFMLGALAQLLTLLEFPHRFAALTRLDPGAVALVGVRNVLLAAFLTALVGCAHARLAGATEHARAAGATVPRRDP